jgi:hypothetical protein
VTNKLPGGEYWPKYVFFDIATHNDNYNDSVKGRTSIVVCVDRDEMFLALKSSELIFFKQDKVLLDFLNWQVALYHCKK